MSIAKGGWAGDPEREKQAMTDRAENERKDKEIEALNCLLAKMREALLKYGRHYYSCGRGVDGRPDGTGKCSCGFEGISLTPASIKDKLQSLRTHAEQMAGALLCLSEAADIRISKSHNDTCDTQKIQNAQCSCGSELLETWNYNAKRKLTAYRQAFPEKEGV